MEIVKSYLHLSNSYQQLGHILLKKVKQHIKVVTCLCRIEK